MSIETGGSPLAWEVQKWVLHVAKRRFLQIGKMNPASLELKRYMCVTKTSTFIHIIFQALIH